MPNSTIDTLRININSSAKTSKKAVNDLIKSLENLKSTLEDVDTKTIVNDIDSIGASSQQANNRLKSFGRGAKGATDGLKSFGKAAAAPVAGLRSLDSAIKRNNKGTASLVSTMGKLYATFWTLRKAFGWAKSSIDFASNLTEVQNVVRNAFGPEAEKMVNDFAGSFSILNFGMSELTAKQVASNFQAMGKTLGVTNEMMLGTQDIVGSLPSAYDSAADSVADMSMNLTKLAGDLASFYNIDATEAAQKLQAVYTGQTRPLRTLGLDLTQANLESWALSKGISVSMKNMTQAEKTTLRYAYVMDNARLAMGDFVATADTYANVVRTLKQQFQSLGGIIGGVFINAFKPALIAMRNFMQKVLDFAKTIADALGSIFGWTIDVTAGGGGYDDVYDGIADSLDDASGGADGLADGLDDASKSAKDLVDKLTVLPFDELNQLAKDTADSRSGTGSGSGSGRGSGSSGSGGGMSGNGASVALVRTEATVDKIKSSIKTLGELGEYISKTLTNAMRGIKWNDIYKKAENFGSGLASFLNGLIKPDLFSELGGTIAGAINTALHAANAFATGFEFDNLGNSIAAGINEFARDVDLDLAVDSFNKWANGILETMITAIGGVEWGPLGKKVSDALMKLDIEGVAEHFGELITTKFNAIAEFVGEINWVGLGTKLGDSINRFFKGLKLEEVGADLNLLANSILDFLIAAVDEVEWEDVGTEIGEFLENLDPIQIASKFAKLLEKVIYAGIDIWSASFDAAPIETTILTAVGVLKFTGLGGKLATAMGKSLLRGPIELKNVPLTISLPKIFTALNPAAIAIIGTEILEKVEIAVRKVFGEDKGEFLLNSIGSVLMVLTGSTIGFILGGPIGAFVGGFVGILLNTFAQPEWTKKVGEGIEKWLNGGFDKITSWGAMALDIVNGLFKGFSDNAIGWSTKVNENIVKPFIKAIKDLFGIHSPSTVMKEIGGYLVSGLFSGLQEKWSTVTEFFSTKLTGIKNLLADPIGTIKVALDKSVEDAKNELDYLKETTIDKVVNASLGDTFKRIFGEDGLGGIFALSTTPKDVKKTANGATGPTFNSIFGANGLGGIFALNTTPKTVLKTAMGKTGETFNTVFGPSGNGGIFALASAAKTVLKTAKATIGPTFTKIFGESGGGGVFALSKAVKSVTKEALGEIADSFSELFGSDGTGGAYGAVEDKTVEAEISGSEDWTFTNAYADYSDLADKTVSVTIETTSKYYEMYGGYNGGILTKNGFKNFPSYARGGTPPGGQIFRARENGNPELVGTLKGSTAVMNNDDIVASVSDGVARAISSVQFNMQGYQTPNIDSAELANVIEYAVASAMSSNTVSDRPIYITVKTQNDEVLARAVQRGTKRLDYRANAVGA